MPYAPANVNQVFARGGTIEDIRQEPFFAGVRSWQKNYGFHEPGKMADGNLLMACPSGTITKNCVGSCWSTSPTRLMITRGRALLDPGYAEGLFSYDEALERLTRPIWRSNTWDAPGIELSAG